MRAVKCLLSKFIFSPDVLARWRHSPSSIWPVSPLSDMYSQTIPVLYYSIIVVSLLCQGGGPNTLFAKNSRDESVAGERSVQFVMCSVRCT